MNNKIEEIKAIFDRLSSNGQERILQIAKDMKHLQDAAKSNAQVPPPTNPENEKAPGKAGR